MRAALTLMRVWSVTRGGMHVDEQIWMIAHMHRSERDAGAIHGDDGAVRMLHDDEMRAATHHGRHGTHHAAHMAVDGDAGARVRVDTRDVRG